MKIEIFVLYLVHLEIRSVCEKMWEKVFLQKHKQNMTI